MAVCLVEGGSDTHGEKDETIDLTAVLAAETETW